MVRLHWAYFAAGIVIFVILHLHFVWSWDALYAAHPWRGYHPGVAPAFFSTSPRSLLIASLVLLAAALGLTLIPPGQRPGTGAALWIGVMSAVVLVWIATPRLRQDSNMGPIDLVLLSLMTGVPMLIGRTIGLIYWRIRITQPLNPWLVAAAFAALIIAGMCARLFA